MLTWLTTADTKLTFVGSPPKYRSREADTSIMVTYCSSRTQNICGGSCTVYNGGPKCLEAPGSLVSRLRQTLASATMLDAREAAMTSITAVRASMKAFATLRERRASSFLPMIRRKSQLRTCSYGFRLILKHQLLRSTTNISQRLGTAVGV